MRYKQIVGNFGEELARKYLVSKGYEIIGKNIKNSYQEIDIIAKLKQELVFVEVKTRTSGIYGQADESISQYKYKNIKKAVADYLFNYNLIDKIVRVDLIAIDINKAKKIAKIKHYKNIV